MEISLKQKNITNNKTLKNGCIFFFFGWIFASFFKKKKKISTPPFPSTNGFVFLMTD